jgi:propionate CoA-transferase
MTPKKYLKGLIFTFDFIDILFRFVSYKITETRYKSDYCPDVNGGRKFVSAKAAAGMIKNGDTVFSAGIAAHCRCSIFYWVLRDRYLEDSEPKDLTWITTAAHGGRGKVPGTIEEIAIPGLMSEYICSHVETAKSQLALADSGDLRIHTIPYGEITFLLEALARGETSILSETGLDTFLDPEYGGTTAVVDPSGKSYVEREERQLRYHLPLIDVALIAAPYADEEGNIYFTDAACITDHKEAALAAHAQGGKVIVAVARLIPIDRDAIGIPAEFITAIVVNPWSEQTGGIRQNKCLSMLTAGGNEDIERGINKLRIINRIVGITSKRGAADQIVARMAAWQFTQAAKGGDLVNLGVGIPEEVGRLLYTHDIYSRYTFSTEAGALGGIPAMGVYFGAALNPKSLHSSAWMFKHYKEHLSVAVFGFLQVDSHGNVNVSKRGDGVQNYVGPGGLINIAESAQTIIFVGHWMANGRYRVQNGTLSIKKRGRIKFVDKVDEVTFCAKRAIDAGRQVFYVTTVGVFQLTADGLKMIYVMPGIDIEKDIVQASTAKFILPPDNNVSFVPTPVVTGRNFALAADNNTHLN